VSRICTEIATEMTAWQQRRLDEVELDYLFLDASLFRYHLGAAAEPVLAAWGITTAGKPVFVGLDTAAAESTDAWAAFLADLGARGLACPLLVISDGAAGLIAAIEQTMPAALRQRCLIHRARNLLAKIPTNAQAEVKADYWALFEVPDTLEPGLHTVAHVQTKIDDFARRWRGSYPAAVRILLSDRESLTHYLRVPREHWSRVRHSNFIERTFGQPRRRAKVIGRLPGETSCINLVWAVLDRSSRGARGFTMTPTGVRIHHDPHRSAVAPGPTPHPARTTHPATTPRTHPRHRARHRRGRGLTSTATRGSLRSLIYTARETRPLE
jgi:putative transposase